MTMRLLIEIVVGAYLLYFVWLLMLCRRAQRALEDSARVSAERPGKVIPFRPRRPAIEGMIPRNYQIR
jgi:threonine/homoserine/homoserine lactone efflux protein